MSKKSPGMGGADRRTKVRGGSVVGTQDAPAEGSTSGVVLGVSRSAVVDSGGGSSNSESASEPEADSKSSSVGDDASASISVMMRRPGRVLELVALEGPLLRTLFAP